MNEIKILVDSCSSLTKAEAESLGVTIIPTTFILDGNEYNPVECDIPYGEYYEIIKTCKISTACLNEYAFEEAFTPIVENGDGVICVTLSGGLSATYKNACSVAENLNAKYGNKIAIIDSQTGSSGLMFAITKAVELAKEGKSVQEIKECVDKNALGITSYFTIGSLTHLYRGGRLSKTTAVVGNALKAKPIIQTDEEGKLVIKAIHLGKKKTLKEMAYLVLDEVDDTWPVYVSNTNVDSECDYFRGKLLEGNPNLKFINTTIDYTMGAHCGPETVAVFFKRK